MKIIPLTKGKSALVDDEDFAAMAAHQWYCSSAGYAMRGGGRGHHVLMHRQLLGLTGGDGKVVDHINRDTLDNRRSNLRIVTHAENLRNSKMKSNNKSGFKGISWHEPLQLWRARIMVNGRHISLGCFKSPEEAYAAYCLGAETHHGEFRRTK